MFIWCNIIISRGSCVHICSLMQLFLFWKLNLFQNAGIGKEGIPALAAIVASYVEADFKNQWLQSIELVHFSLAMMISSACNNLLFLTNTYMTFKFETSTVVWKWRQVFSEGTAFNTSLRLKQVKTKVILHINVPVCINFIIEGGKLFSYDSELLLCQDGYLRRANILPGLCGWVLSGLTRNMGSIMKLIAVVELKHW